MNRLRKYLRLLLGTHSEARPNPEFNEILRSRWYLPLYLRSRLRAEESAHLFANLRLFCIFVGFPRSGHSLLGSLLDDHPNIVIAHELDALGLLAAGFREHQIYYLALKNSEAFARTGRGWSGYSYEVPGGHQGRYATLRVLGDKKGSRTSMRLLRQPELLERLQAELSVPLHLILYYRNPFDIIGSMSKRHGMTRPDPKHVEYCMQVVQLLSSLRQEWPTDLLTEVYHEDFVASPARSLEHAVDGLGEAGASEAYVERASAIVRTTPSLSRNRVAWPPETVEALERRIHLYPFLSSYSFSA